MERGILALVLLAGVLSLACEEPAKPRAAAPGCREDLQASFGLVEQNYAGYADKVARLGADTIARAREDALHELGAAREERCLEILNAWLDVFQDGHVYARAPVSRSELPDVAAGKAAARQAPQFELLSDRAAWLRVSSFERGYRAEIEALIAEHRPEIQARSELIIDVRGNGGGVDASYEPLAALVYTQPVPSPGVDVLATPANIAAWERILSDLDGDDRAEIEELVARMRARPGHWVELVGDTTIRHSDVLAAPARVAVITDARCASSCEQFVLEARESAKVRLFGAPTAGVLDYSNVVTHPLPSGRLLGLATTRSRRLPEQPIDGTGILPDVVLDPTSLDGETREAALGGVLEELRRGEANSGD
jgi:hypothetical protein